MLTKEEFFKQAPAHLVQAVKDGKTANFGGENYTLASLGVDVAASSTVDLAVQAQIDQARIRELEEQVADLQAQVEGERITVTGDLPALIEALIPDNKSGLFRLPVDALQKVATYRGIETEGKDKETLVSELLPKEEQ